MIKKSAKETSYDKEDELKKLVTHKEIEGTPFLMVRYDNQYFIGMGKYRLTETFSSEEECLKEMNTWIFQITVMGTICNEMIINKLNKKQDE